MGQRTLRALHWRGAGAGGQSLSTPGASAGRGARAPAGIGIQLCGGVARVAGLVQPVGGIRQ
ncbi:chaplin family protein [Achromobacter sp. JD417]|uniref:chaplin family protein n=1 Tax=Achromobacter sp. JD417 TaxID=2893881 RepID=UPI0035A69DD9